MKTGLDTVPCSHPSPTPVCLEGPVNMKKYLIFTTSDSW